MAPTLRKAALSAHVTTSVGLLGAIAAFSALALIGMEAQDPATIRAAYFAMDLIARLIIVPLALLALLIGIAVSLGTRWGLVRHYWIVAKLILTTFATAVLLIKLDLISYAARLVKEDVLARGELRVVGAELALHALAGLGVLMVPAILSVYKPAGLTSYGRRKQESERTAFLPPQPSPAANSPSSIHSGNPDGRGFVVIKLGVSELLGLAALIAVVHLAVLHLTGFMGYRFRLSARPVTGARAFRH